LSIGRVVCSNCHKRITEKYYEEHLVVCKKYFTSWEEEAVDGAYKESQYRTSRARRQAVSKGRKCLKCGRDPKPNYYYCPGCIPDEPY
jgi:hypothetical protein